MSNLRSQVVSGLRWTAGARIVSQVFTWAMTIIVIRLLTPGDYGLLAMANIFVAFLMLMSEIGLGLSIVQADKVELPELRQIFGLVILSNMSLCVLLLVLAPLIASFFNEPRLTMVIQALAAQFPLVALTSIPKALLERKMDFKPASMLEAISAIINGVVVLLLAYWGYGVWALVWGNLVGLLLRAIGFQIMSPFREWPTFSLAGMRRFVFFGGHVTLARMLWFFYSQVDSFIVGKLLGKEPLGIYSVSMHLAGLPVARVSSVLNQVAMPAFSRVQNDLGAASAHFLKAARLMAFVVFPVSWGMSAVAPELVDLLMGKHWAGAAMPLLLLCLIMPFRMLSSMIPAAVQGLGRPEVSVMNQISACVVMPIAFVIGSQWGLLGISIAWVLGFPLVLLGNLFRAMPVVGLTVWQLVRSQVPPAICAGGMWGAVELLRLVVGDLALIPRLSLLVASGGAMYVLLAWSINRAGCQEALGFFRRKG
ncbi:O-antigen/teichoic acid export membrane protein [Chitinivorax tropicus]|uniref:O-antigen/teichoic acid export membrane protein n=1 Tax=Chitinivorax tropicus TaxID=714531 RepID=A0A840MUN9_9PROT|nr:lipopolysaccharide biosynthesis protein [Chitinivorax tropicus]MBB5018891.1 O-antigen/teichoic acid export membrane protein [Chitinivorax tropicus]